ncbi:hypothetical protein BC834DRAFT_158220 [Gloeopeniophorella convolvens]|nr:hypothetical protein BC834DRAFT_158220 [Gloeopeniophorella convolvens]
MRMVVVGNSYSPCLLIRTMDAPPVPAYVSRRGRHCAPQRQMSSSECRGNASRCFDGYNRQPNRDLDGIGRWTSPPGIAHRCPLCPISARCPTRNTAQGDECRDQPRFTRKFKDSSWKYMPSETVGFGASRCLVVCEGGSTVTICSCACIVDAHCRA